jgi:sugar-specific transcriptional regulator TrmB
VAVSPFLEDVVGLTADESRVYVEVVGLASATALDLGTRTGHAGGDVERILAALELKGLVARSSEDTARFVALPPAVAVGAVLVRRQSELRLAEIELESLDELYRGGVAERGAADVVDVISGPDAMRQSFEQLQLAARREVQVFVKAPVSLVSTAENTAEDDAVARGVRYRVLMERAMFDVEPGTFDDVRRALEAGEEVRIANELPLKLLIVDREHAFLPVGGAGDPVMGALVVRRSGLLDALCALFESEWSRATALTVGADTALDEAPRMLDAADAEILGLLLAGLNDKATAYHLGTSLRTVQRRVRQLMQLVGAETRMQLGWHAAQLGWPDGAPRAHDDLAAPQVDR